MMKWEHVLLDKKDYIGTITLNRPEKMNAFGGMMRQEIGQAVEEVCADSDVRVIVITGAGKAFCVGGDVDEFVSGETKALEDIGATERPAMSKIVMALNSVEKPVIAAVNGVAAGGGMNLALACDIRIASEKAKFGQVFTRRGVHPDWGGIYFLPRLVGYAKAAELIFSGEVVSAKEALRIGIVNRVTPDDELMSTANKLASRIAHNAPIPISFAKRGLQNFHKWDLATALDYEAYVLGITMKSEDFMEGFKSFLEKRQPLFKGR
ncbi:MAG: enoyl-CoA hydratase [Desulfatiglans sp.]|jgi:2-(1,2-epoxy-1,2-dihydrophenyl)acetyl-CoA isomerase|nr:enoyl-CoA hydratase [Thermodesulfobacteriota bacterium]MEE4354685.1 enoyl-CoA hydratase [Desulfatiglans sp.]